MYVVPLIIEVLYNFKQNTKTGRFLNWDHFTKRRKKECKDFLSVVRSDAMKNVDTAMI